MIPSRAKGNVTFDLNKLLCSIVLNAENTASIELLVVVDKDDDLDRYFKLQRRYSNEINLRIYVSDIRHGYLNLHKYWKIAMDNMSPYSKMFSLCTDDIHITKKHFDRELLDIDNQFPDNLYLVHTQIIGNIKLFGKNWKSSTDDIHPAHKTMFYTWTTMANPQSYFPFCSRKILDIGKKLQQNTKNLGDNWSYLLNCYAGDWYISFLGDLMTECGAKGRVIYRDLISRNMASVADHHIKQDSYGFYSWQYLFQVFFKRSTIEHLKKIALEIVKHQK